MLTQFEYPRISGSLNNCALNCALPTMMRVMSDYTNDVGVPENYQLIKRLFEEFYNLPHLSWQTFNSFLSQHNFSENELILAPILRNFMKTKTKEPETIYSFQENGRYRPLTDEEANNYFYSHFGLYLYVHQFTDSNEEYISLPLVILDINEGLQPISVYYKNEHFELQAHEELPTNQIEKEELVDIRTKITSGNSILATQEAFNDLKAYTKQALPKSYLKQLLNDYQTDYYYLHLFLWIISFGYHKCCSDTILILQALLKSDCNEITKENIAETIIHPKNNDSKKLLRYNFWISDIPNEEIPEPTATDRLLSQLKEIF